MTDTDYIRTEAADDAAAMCRAVLGARPHCRIDQITGQPGTGKSAMTIWLAEELDAIRIEVLIVAGHMATKGREIGRVTGYERAGIQKVQMRAHLDERTTPVCRQLHGRVIEVQTLADQRDAYFAASVRGDKLAMADIWTMHGKGADLSNVPTRDLSGVGSPPYHYRCRTITVAYWETATETPLDGAPADQPALTLEHISEKVYQREPLTRREIGAIVERARTAHWASARDSYRRHFAKHGATMGLPFQDEYNQSAIDLIRRGNRDVYLSMRNGTVDVVFARPEVNAAGDSGFFVTVVGLEGNVIHSHMWKTKVQSSIDEVPAFLQPGRGVMKWLTGWRRA